MAIEYDDYVDYEYEPQDEEEQQQPSYEYPYEEEAAASADEDYSPFEGRSYDDGEGNVYYDWSLGGDEGDQAFEPIGDQGGQPNEPEPRTTDLSSPYYEPPPPPPEGQVRVQVRAPSGYVSLDIDADTIDRWRAEQAQTGQAGAPRASADPNAPTQPGPPAQWDDGAPMTEEEKRLARVYEQSVASGLDDEGARVMVAVAKTENGLFGAVGDQGTSFGPFQLHVGGQFDNFVKWVKEQGIQGDPRALANDIDLATRFAAENYLGRTIRQGQEQGLHHSQLATYAQAHGQVSINPERTGQNYAALFYNQPLPNGQGTGFRDRYKDALAAAVPTQQQRDERGKALPPGHYIGDGHDHDKPATPYTDQVAAPDGSIWTIAFDYDQPYANPFNKDIPRHRGIDLIVPNAEQYGLGKNGEGATYTAFQSGVVVGITNDEHGGIGIITQDPKTGLYSRYFHNNNVLVKQGDQVVAGQTPLGVVGETGSGGFPHLHFEVSRNINGDPTGQTIDPRQFVAAPVRSTTRAATPATAPTVTTFATPNKSGVRQTTDGIIVHTTNGGAADAQAEFDATIRHFNDPNARVSANAVIGPDGTIAFTGNWDDQTWHARSQNSHKIGIEIAQTAADNLAGKPITDAQYQSLAWLTKQLSDRYGFDINRTTIRGHSETPDGQGDHKVDPGRQFDWDRYIAAARSGGAAAPHAARAQAPRARDPNNPFDRSGVTVNRQPVTAQSQRAPEPDNPFDRTPRAPVQAAARPANAEEFAQREEAARQSMGLDKHSFDLLREWQRSLRPDEDGTDVAAFRAHLGRLGAPDPWTQREQAQQAAQAAAQRQQAAPQQPGTRTIWRDRNGNEITEAEANRLNAEVAARNAEIDRQNAAITRINEGEQARYAAAQQEVAAVRAWERRAEAAAVDPEAAMNLGQRPATPNLDFIQSREAAGMDTAPREQTQQQREPLAAWTQTITEQPDLGPREATRAQNAQFAQNQALGRLDDINRSLGLNLPTPELRTPEGLNQIQAAIAREQDLGPHEGGRLPFQEAYIRQQDATGPHEQVREVVPARADAPSPERLEEVRQEYLANGYTEQQWLEDMQAAGAMPSVRPLRPVVSAERPWWMPSPDATVPPTGTAADLPGFAFGFTDPLGRLDQNDPFVQAARPWIDAYQNDARGATVGIASSLNSYANGALEAAGLGDTQVAQVFQQNRNYFNNLTRTDPRYRASEIDWTNPSSYADPKTYLAAMGQVIPSVMAAMATGGMVAAALPEAAFAAPIAQRATWLGTRGEALGSALFTLPTSAGSTYDDLRQLGATPQEAFVGANISGALQGALEVINPHDALGVLRRMREIPGGGSLTRRIFGAAREIVGSGLKEGFEEASQQVADNAIQRWFGSDKSWLDQVPQNFFVGAIGGLGLGAPGAAANLRQARAQATMDTAQEQIRQITNRENVDILPVSSDWRHWEIRENDPSNPELRPRRTLLAVGDDGSVRAVSWNTLPEGTTRPAPPTMTESLTAVRNLGNVTEYLEQSGRLSPEAVDRTNQIFYDAATSAAETMREPALPQSRAAVQASPDYAERVAAEPKYAKDVEAMPDAWGEAHPTGTAENPGAMTYRTDAAVPVEQARAMAQIPGFAPLGNGIAQMVAHVDTTLRGIGALRGTAQRPLGFVTSMGAYRALNLQTAGQGGSQRAQAGLNPITVDFGQILSDARRQAQYYGLDASDPNVMVPLITEGLLDSTGHEVGHEFVAGHTTEFRQANAALVKVLASQYGGMARLVAEAWNNGTLAQIEEQHNHMVAQYGRREDARDYAQGEINAGRASVLSPDGASGERAGTGRAADAGPVSDGARGGLGGDAGVLPGRGAAVGPGRGADRGAVAAGVPGQPAAAPAAEHGIGTAAADYYVAPESADTVEQQIRARGLPVERRDDPATGHVVLRVQVPNASYLAGQQQLRSIARAARQSGDDRVQMAYVDAVPATGSVPSPLVPLELARRIPSDVQLPLDDPLFQEALANTPGARVTEDGLELPLVRMQQPEQAGMDSVRTGVFYMLADLARHIRVYAKGNWYGGPMRIAGTSVFRRPMFVRASTGGRAPEMAFNRAWEEMYGRERGLRPIQALDDDIARINPLGQWGHAPKGSDEQIISHVAAVLGAYGYEQGGEIDPYDLARNIVENSRRGNQFRYAMREAVVAQALRDAGYDSVISLTTTKGRRYTREARMGEVFDVRERTYPYDFNGGITELHPQYAMRDDGMLEYQGAPLPQAPYEPREDGFLQTTQAPYSPRRDGFLQTNATPSRPPYLLRRDGFLQTNAAPTRPPYTRRADGLLQTSAPSPQAPYDPMREMAMRNPGYEPGTPEQAVEDALVVAAREQGTHRPELSGAEITAMAPSAFPNPASPAIVQKVDENGEPRFQKDGKTPVMVESNHGIMPDLADLRMAREFGWPARRWYRDFGRWVNDIVGPDNFHEFRAVFGVTSAQTPPVENMMTTLSAMRIIREMVLDGTFDQADALDTFHARMKAERYPAVRDNVAQLERDGSPKMAGFRTYTGSKAKQIMDLYKNGQVVIGSNAKTSSYAGNLLAALLNIYDPNTTIDVWMARGMNYHSTAWMAASDAAYRASHALTNWLAREVGIPPHEAQAAIWFPIKTAWERGGAGVRRQIMDGKLGDALAAVNNAGLLNPDLIRGDLADVTNSIRVQLGVERLLPVLEQHYLPPGAANGVKDTIVFPGKGRPKRPVDNAQRATVRDQAEGDAPVITLPDAPTALAMGLENGGFPWLEVPNRVIQHGDGSFSVDLPGGSLDTARYVAAEIGSQIGAPSILIHQPDFQSDTLGGVRFAVPDTPLTTEQLSDIVRALQSEGAPFVVGPAGAYIALVNDGSVPESMVYNSLEKIRSLGIEGLEVGDYNADTETVQQADYEGILEELGDRFRAQGRPDLQAQNAGGVPARGLPSFQAPWDAAAFGRTQSVGDENAAPDIPPAEQSLFGRVANAVFHGDAAAPQVEIVQVDRGGDQIPVPHFRASTGDLIPLEQDVGIGHRWANNAFRQAVRQQGGQKQRLASIYNAADGNRYRYASMLEAATMVSLDRRKEAGEIRNWWPLNSKDRFNAVPYIHRRNLQDISRYYPDFLIEHNDGSLEVVETKSLNNVRANEEFGIGSGGKGAAWAATKAMQAVPYYASHGVQYSLYTERDVRDDAARFGPTEAHPGIDWRDRPVIGRAGFDTTNARAQGVVDAINQASVDALQAFQDGVPYGGVMRQTRDAVLLASQRMGRQHGNVRIAASVTGVATPGGLEGGTFGPEQLDALAERWPALAEAIEAAQSRSVQIHGIVVDAVGDASGQEVRPRAWINASGDPAGMQAIAAELAKATVDSDVAQIQVSDDPNMPRLETLDIENPSPAAQQSFGELQQMLRDAGYPYLVIPQYTEGTLARLLIANTSEEDDQRFEDRIGQLRATLRNAAQIEATPGPSGHAEILDVAGEGGFENVILRRQQELGEAAFPGFDRGTFGRGEGDSQAAAGTRQGASQAEADTRDAVRRRAALPAEALAAEQAWPQAAQRAQRAARARLPLPDLIARAQELRAQGLTHRAIANELGISPGSASRYINRHQPSTSGKSTVSRRRGDLDARRAMAQDLRAKNPEMSYVEIGRQVGVSAPTAFNYVKMAEGNPPAPQTGWAPPEQGITSAATSLRQIPAVHKRVPWQTGQTNLDIGGGRYDRATEYLRDQHGVTNLVYDPFNRSPEHNEAVLAQAAEMGGADTATVANVLNVIQEPANRRSVLEMAAELVRPGGTVHIGVYEGDRSGQGQATPRGWQENRRLRDYLPEVREVFPDAVARDGRIEAIVGAPAREIGQGLPSPDAIWEPAQDQVLDDISRLEARAEELRGRVGTRDNWGMDYAARDLKTVEAQLARRYQIAALIDSQTSRTFPGNVEPRIFAPAAAGEGIRESHDWNSGAETAYQQAGGGTIRGVPMDPDDPRIPPVVYHASTNLPAVLDTGMLLAAGQGGLGGDRRDNIVSMTINRQIADQIAYDLRLAAEIGRILPPLVQRTVTIDTQGGGQTSYERPEYDATPEETRAAFDRANDRLKQEAAAHGWQFDALDDYSSDRQITLMPKEIVGQFFSARSYRTEMKDPLIYTEDLRRFDPATIGVVAIPRENLRTGALLTDFDLGRGHLEEIRLYGDVPIGDPNGDVMTEATGGLGPLPTAQAPWDPADPQIVRSEEPFYSALRLAVEAGPMGYVRGEGRSVPAVNQPARIVRPAASIKPGETPRAGSPIVVDEQGNWVMPGRSQPAREETGQTAQMQAIEYLLDSGVKPEELIWTGLALPERRIEKGKPITWSTTEGWLAQQGDAFLMDDLLAYIDANRVHVSEVIQGEGGTTEVTQAMRDRLQQNRRHAEIQEARLEHRLAVNDLLAPHTDLILQLGRAYQKDMVATPDPDGVMDPEDYTNRWLSTMEYLPEGNREVKDAWRMAMSAWAELGDAERRIANPPPRATKYGNYIAPGGQRYREMLITLPIRGADPNASPEVVQAQAQMEEVNRSLAGRWGQTDPETMALLRERVALENRITQAAESPEAEAYRETNYGGSHWSDVKNVVVHVRFDERRDAQGRPVLYVDEIQSDWHQEGRKHGIRGVTTQEIERRAQEADRLNEQAQAIFNDHVLPHRDALEQARADLATAVDRDIDQAYRREADQAPPAERARLREERLQAVERRNDAEDALRRAQEESGYRALNDRAREMREQVRTLQEGIYSMVPDAPFANTWNEMAMRRMIRWAAENGFAQVAWPYGKVHTDRWGTERATWRRNPDDERSWLVTIDPYVGGEAGGINIEEAAQEQGIRTRGDEYEVFDKDGLRQLVEGEDGLGYPGAREILEERTATDRLWQKMQEADEGVWMPRHEGMQAFYDRILPSIAEKLGKPFGATVSTARIGRGMEVHALEIPGEMARSAAEQGFPLFQTPWDPESETPDIADPRDDPELQAILDDYANEQEVERSDGGPRTASPAEMAANPIPPGQPPGTVRLYRVGPDGDWFTTDKDYAQSVGDDIYYVDIPPAVLAESRQGRVPKGARAGFPDALMVLLPAARVKAARPYQELSYETRAAQAAAELRAQDVELSAEEARREAGIEGEVQDIGAPPETAPEATSERRRPPDMSQVRMDMFPEWARGPLDVASWAAEDRPPRSEISPEQVADVRQALSQGPNAQWMNGEEIRALGNAILLQYAAFADASVRAAATNDTPEAAWRTAQALDQGRRFSALLSLATTPNQSWGALESVWRSAPVSGGESKTLGEYLRQAREAGGSPEARRAAIQKAAENIQRGARIRGPRTRKAIRSVAGRVAGGISADDTQQQAQVAAVGRTLAQGVRQRGTKPTAVAATLDNVDLSISPSDILLGFRYNNLLFGPRGILVDYGTNAAMLFYKAATDPMLPNTGGLNPVDRLGITLAEYHAGMASVWPAMKLATRMILDGVSDAQIAAQGAPHTISGRLQRRIENARDEGRPTALLHAATVGSVAWIEMAGRLKSVADVTIRTIATHMELARLAGIDLAAEANSPTPGSPTWFREIQQRVAFPTDENRQLADREAARVVFQGAMGTVGKKLEIIQQHPLGSFILPFLRALYHIRGWGIDLGPVGAAVTVGDVMRAGVYRGLARTDVGLAAMARTRNLGGLLGGPYQRAFRGTEVGPGVADLDRRMLANALGTAAFFYLLGEALAGNITDGGPPDDPLFFEDASTDPAKRQLRATMEARGWQRYSIRIPWNGQHYYVQYSNWGPFALLLGGVAAIADTYQYGLPKEVQTRNPGSLEALYTLINQGDRSTAMQATRRFFSVAKDMTYLSGFMDLYQLGQAAVAANTNIGAPEDETPSERIRRQRYARAQEARYLGNILTTFVPAAALVNTIAQGQDPYNRSTEYGSIRDQLAARIPQLGGPLPDSLAVVDLPSLIAARPEGSPTGRRMGMAVTVDPLGEIIRNPYHAEGGVPWNILPVRATKEDLSRESLNLLVEAGVGAPSAPSEMYYRPEATKGQKRPDAVWVLLTPGERMSAGTFIGQKIDGAVKDLARDWPEERRLANPDEWHDTLASTVSDTARAAKRELSDSEGYAQRVLAPLARDPERVRPWEPYRPRDEPQDTSAPADTGEVPDIGAPPASPTATPRPSGTPRPTATPAPSGAPRVATPRPTVAPLQPAAPAPSGGQTQAERDRQIQEERRRTR